MDKLKAPVQVNEYPRNTPHIREKTNMTIARVFQNFAAVDKSLRNIYTHFSNM